MLFFTKIIKKTLVMLAPVYIKNARAAGHSVAGGTASSVVVYAHKPVTPQRDCCHAYGWLELGSHPESTQIGDALVYVGG